MSYLRRCAAIAAAIAVGAVSSATANPVTVQTESGGLSLTGEIVAFDGTYLSLGTEYGPITVDVRGMTCDGADCSRITDFVPTLRFSGAARLTGYLYPALVEGYARSKGFVAERTDTADGEFSYLLTPNSGAGVLFEFSVSDSTDGFADLAAGTADIALSQRRARPDETAGRLRIIALDALTAAVTAGHELRSISVQDLAGILSGEVSDWSEMGLAPGAIEVILGAQDGAYSEELAALVLGPTGRRLSDGIRTYPTQTAVAEAVSANPAAITVLPIGALGNTRSLLLAEQCGVRLIPRIHSVKAEDYPLTFPLYYYIAPRRLPAHGLDFLAWLNTAEAQLVIRRAGLVDLGGVPVPLELQGERFAAAIALAGDDVGLAELQRLVRFATARSRLSSTFRFEPGSSNLDAPSQSHLYSVSAAIRSGRYDGRQLTLVGFSDAEGSTSANRDLSRARAEAVRDAILADLRTDLPEGVLLDVESFGEALPMGCDDTEWGRQINRRVELWVSE